MPVFTEGKTTCLSLVQVSAFYVANEYHGSHRTSRAQRFLFIYRRPSSDDNSALLDPARNSSLPLLSHACRSSLGAAFPVSSRFQTAGQFGHKFATIARHTRVRTVVLALVAYGSH